MSKNTGPPAGSSLRLEDQNDLLLVLLYAPGKSGQKGEPVDGLTRLQKLMFLLQEESLESLLSDVDGFGYEPNKFGPYSPSLVRALEELRSAGIIDTRALEYTFADDSDAPRDFEFSWDLDLEVVGAPRVKRVESTSYSLSPFGMQIAAELWGSLSKDHRKQFAEFKSFFNSITLRQLLIYTYEKHRDFTGESVIREKLGVD